MNEVIGARRRGATQDGPYLVQVVVRLRLSGQAEISDRNQAVFNPR